MTLHEVCRIVVKSLNVFPLDDCIIPMSFPSGDLKLEKSFIFCAIRIGKPSFPLHREFPNKTFKIDFSESLSIIVFGKELSNIKSGTIVRFNALNFHVLSIRLMINGLPHVIPQLFNPSNK